jgi:hypothetical protein
MNLINFELADEDVSLDLFAGEPTKEALDHEEVVDVKAWNLFRCPKCRKVRDMLKCKSLEGFILCPCGHLN